VTTDLSLPSEPLLVAAQQAAMARLRDAICRGGVAVLCGPAGSGKTMLLTRLASEQAAVTGRPSGPYPLRQLVDNPDNGPQRVALIDDAHAAVDAAQLRRVVDSIERLTTSTAVVLAGEGRLLTLLMRQPDLEQRVRLRAVLPAWSESESVSLITSALPAMMARAEGPRLASRMHELAAGIPRQLVRLIDTVGMVLAAEPGHDLSVDDLETFHRRLFLQAA
jgi:type II secretory pathway predicted ATPase ExeA